MKKYYSLLICLGTFWLQAMEQPTGSASEANNPSQDAHHETGIHEQTNFDATSQPTQIRLGAEIGINMLQDVKRCKRLCSTPTFSDYPINEKRYRFVGKCIDAYNMMHTADSVIELSNYIDVISHLHSPAQTEEDQQAMANGRARGISSKEAMGTLLHNLFARLNTRTSSGDTVFNALVKHKKGDVAQCLLGIINMSQPPLPSAEFPYYLDLCTPDYSGVPPLFYALHYKQTALAEDMINCIKRYNESEAFPVPLFPHAFNDGARHIDNGFLKTTGALYCSYLMCAAAQGNTTACKLLLEAGAHIDLKNKDQETALTYAAREGKTEVAKLLLAAGANPCLMNRAGKRASDYVQQEQHPELRELLRTAQETYNEQFSHQEPALEMPPLDPPSKEMSTLNISNLKE